MAYPVQDTFPRRSRKRHAAETGPAAQVDTWRERGEFASESRTPVNVIRRDKRQVLVGVTASPYNPSVSADRPDMRD